MRDNERQVSPLENAAQGDCGRSLTSVELLLRRQPPVLLLAGLFGLSIREPVAAIFTLIWKHHTWK